MNNFMNKRASELTVGESLKFGVACGIATMALSGITAVVIEHGEDIVDFFKEKFKKKKTTQQ